MRLEKLKIMTYEENISPITSQDPEEEKVEGEGGEEKVEVEGEGEGGIEKTEEAEGGTPEATPGL